MVISSFAIGVLGKSLFYLGFVDAILVVLFFNLLGIMPVCFFSSFGMRFGLRQMIVSRFWFGWHGVKISMLTALPSLRSFLAANTPISRPVQRTGLCGLECGEYHRRRTTYQCGQQ